jgi:hypothetical protein
VFSNVILHRNDGNEAQEDKKVNGKGDRRGVALFFL